MNSIVIMGRITKDVELKATASGINYCNFSVAVDRPYRKDQGSKKITDFFSVTAWRGQAELISKYFAKGSRILIRGQMQSRSFDDQNGQKKTVWDLVAEEVRFIDSKADNQQQAAPVQQPLPTPPPAPQAAVPDGYMDATGIPEVELEDPNQLPFDIVG